MGILLCKKIEISSLRFIHFLFFITSLPKPIRQTMMANGKTIGIKDPINSIGFLLPYIVEFYT
jgi:hypothetical protein